MSAPIPPSTTGAVFLSYAHEDADAARRIADALRGIGVEVWFDQSELRGGDSWDQKIRRQIKDCALFLPVISQNTQARGEGYFRLEWKLAVERTHLMAEGIPFLAPIAIDNAHEENALVPPEFMRVHWTRLKNGQPTPQFLDQIKHLVEAPRGAKPAAKVAPASSRPSESAGKARPQPSEGIPALTPKVRRRVPAAAWAAAAVMVAIVAGYFAMRKTEPPAPPIAAPAATRPPTTEKSTPAPAPVSELRQLVAKARALYEPWDFASADDFKLAEQLLKRALDLDPADGEAWAAQSVLSAGFLVFNYDNTPARRESVRTQAERAFKLAPELDLARFARALSFRFQASTQPESLRLLREEAERQPANKLVVRTLGSTLRALGRYEEALAVLDRVAALPGGDPIAHYNRHMALAQLNRSAESEAALDQALVLAPGYGQALGAKINTLLRLHGDLARARALTARMPPAYLTDDRGISVVCFVWWYAHEWDRCIASLAPARDYIQTNFFAGPKALLTGLAHQAAGRPEAARADWRAALQLLEQRLAAQPNATTELGDKAYLLALLGERAEAGRVLQVFEQLTGRTAGRPAHGTWRTYVALGRHEAVIDWLEAAVKNIENDRARGSLMLELRHGPELDPLRGHPRFVALLQSLPPEMK